MLRHLLLLSSLILVSGCLHLHAPEVKATVAQDNTQVIALAMMPELLTLIELPADPKANIEARIDLMDLVVDLLKAGKTDADIIVVFQGIANGGH